MSTDNWRVPKKTRKNRQ